MKRPGRTRFEREWLVLCEGFGDKNFLRNLIDAIDAHRVPGDFQLHVPSGGGRGAFGSFLATAYDQSEDFRANVKAVLVVSDNDDDPRASFEAVRRELGKAEGYGVPDAEWQVAKAPDRPAVVILMIPPGEPANLETMCARAACRKFGIGAALEAYVGATPAAAWGPSKQAKMRMHALLAATCATKPETAFHLHWQEPEAYQVPVMDDEFSPVVERLQAFGALLRAA